jgi:PPM family protein phosphatase
MKYNAIGYTNKGLVRKRNEDSILFSNKFQNNEYAEASFGTSQCFAVFDGVGSSFDGAYASQFAAKKIEAYLMTHQTLDESSLISLLKEISATINVGENKRKSYTTIAGVFFYENEMMVFNVGDTKVYGFYNGKIKLLSTDDTLFAKLVREGKASEKDRKHYIDSHVITQSLGHLDHDKIEFHVNQTQHPEKILICSDGLTDYIDMYDLSILFHECATIDLMHKAFLEKIFKGGAHDNISYILLESVPA